MKAEKITEQVVIALLILMPALVNAKNILNDSIIVLQPVFKFLISYGQHRVIEFHTHLGPFRYDTCGSCCIRN